MAKYPPAVTSQIKNIANIYLKKIYSGFYSIFLLSFINQNYDLR